MKKYFFILLILPLLGLTPEQTTRQAKDFALFFAVDTYDDSGWSDLQNPIRDAEAIAKELRDHYAFETKIYPNPSRETIRQTLAAWQQKAFDKDAQLLVFFSGHGTFGSFANNGFFVPREGKLGDTYNDSHIALTEIGNAVTNIPCEHILLAIDACYSGTIDQKIAFKGDEEKPVMRRRGDTEDFQKERLVEKQLAFKTRRLLTSGEKQRTPDGGRGHSPFTEGILSALRSTITEGDGMLTWRDLLTYMEDVSPTPYYGKLAGHEDGGFVFLEDGSIKQSLASKQAEITAWNQAKGANSIQSYQAFLDEFSGSDFAGLARDNVESLRQMETQRRESDAWQQAQKAQTVAAYQAFVDRFPRSSKAGQARQAIEQLEAAAAQAKDDAAWKRAQGSNTEAAYLGYTSDFSNGKHQQEAQTRLKEIRAQASLRAEILAWEAAKKDDTPWAYRAYLKDYPQGVYADVAQSKLNAPAPSTKGPTDLPGPPMTLVRGGTFEMGCTSEQQDCDSDETKHSTTVSDFYIGKYEVTFEEYDQFCAATGKEKPDDSGWGRGKRPAMRVSWYDAIGYCNWLSGEHSLQPVYTVQKSSQDPNNKSSYDDLKWTVTANWQANGFRLPTEAEWEYAARQRGEKVLFGNGKDVIDPSEINFYSKEERKKSYSIAGNYRGKTVPVGSLNSPNSLKLHDMSGNVWEWCWDWKGDYPSSGKSDYRGATSGSRRVIRGGSWDILPQYCRVAFRSNVGYPDFRSYSYGFRLARTP